MFCGGANPQEVELRPPAIKGGLRFWWRAMHGDWPLDKLKTEEAKLFGGTEKLSYREDGRRVDYEPAKSCFTVEVQDKGLQVLSKNHLPVLKPEWHPDYYDDYKTKKTDLLKYMAYGTYDFHKGFHEYYSVGSNFSILLTLSEGRIKHQKLEVDTVRKELIYCMRLFSTFGGIGQRSRNALGSFKINRIDAKEVDYVGISALRKGEEGKYSHFSANARLFKTRKLYDKWEEAFKEIAEVYRKARLQTEGTKWKFQKRVYIASPLQQAKPYERVLDRHAKPFFMNIRKEGNQFAGYMLFLPSYFVDKSVELSNKNLFVMNARGKNIKDMPDHQRANHNFHLVCNEFIEKALNKKEKEFLEEV